MSYYIFDIDGTLADTSGREKYVRVAPGEKKNWKMFFNYDLMRQDKPIEAVVRVAQMMDSRALPNIYCTGRSEEHRDISVEFIKTHVEHHPKLSDRWTQADVDAANEGLNRRLFMRPLWDNRSDYIVKAELVQQIIEIYGMPLAMFEDRSRVVKAVRALGVRVFQVAEGDY